MLYVVMFLAGMAAFLTVVGGYLVVKGHKGMLPTAIMGAILLVLSLVTWYDQVALQLGPADVAVASDGSSVAGPGALRKSMWRKPNLLVLRKDQVYVRYFQHGNDVVAIFARYKLGATVNGKELYRVANPEGDTAYVHWYVDSLIGRAVSAVPKGEAVTPERLHKAIGTEIEELKKHGLEISIRDVVIIGS